MLTNDSIDDLFELFIYSQIDQNELFELLESKDNKYGNPLPPYFINSPESEQRRAATSNLIEINGDLSTTKRPVFNPYLFYYLARKARKSGKYAKELVKLGNDITERGTESINLSFVFMRYVYLDTIGLKGTRECPTEFYDLITSQKLTTLYDLVICLFSTNKAVLGGIDIKSKRELLKKKMSLPSLIIYKFDDPFLKFALLMECALNVLTEKERNTLKIFAGILQPGNLEYNDYYCQSSNEAIKIIKSFKKKKDTYASLAVKNYVRNNTEEFNGFKENGYSVLYYILMEYGD